MSNVIETSFAVADATPTVIDVISTLAKSPKPIAETTPAVAKTTLTAVEGTSDAELIAAAKELNASIQIHLRRSIEEFWMLGEALSRLQERPSVKGRWREVLKEIGINHTTVNHAQRLYAATTLDNLAGYRNKTAALRALGILSEATPVKKESPDRSSKATTKAAPAKPPVAESAPVGIVPTDSLDIEPTTPSPDLAGIHDGEIVAGVKIDDIMTGTEARETSARIETKGKRPEPAPTEMTLDPLTKITRLAANLEYLAADEFDLTAEFIAQVERAKKALDILHGKGAFHAAA